MRPGVVRLCPLHNEVAFLRGTCLEAGSACVQRRDEEHLYMSLILEHPHPRPSHQLFMQDGSCCMSLTTYNGHSSLIRQRGMGANEQAWATIS